MTTKAIRRSELTELMRAWRAFDPGRRVAHLRNTVIEEAAQIADAEASIEGIAQRIAEKIRALKTKE